MIVANSSELKKYLPSKTAVALGSFDAIHKGHLKVIGRAVDFAKANNLVSLVQIFDVPINKLAINSLAKRLKILEDCGVDAVVIETFDGQFRKIDCQQFVTKYIKDRYSAQKVFAGDNYRFGYMAEGDSNRLVDECNDCGIETEIVECLYIDGVVSSSRIRELIIQGKMEEAAKYMSRPYSIAGEVIHGKGIGRNLGFPTANISLPQTQVLPKDGVYLSRVNFDSQVFWGITNIGAKPTVGVAESNVETYISDFKGDIYGKKIEVEFLKYLREIQAFENLDNLKVQLQKDKKHIPGKNEG